MAHEILIDLNKLVRNFDELYAKVERANVTIKVVQNGKVLHLTRDGKKEKRAPVKSK